MKLITFNTWGGRAGLPLLKKFFETYRDTDVFCLQEIWQTDEPLRIEAGDPRIVTDLLEQIRRYLPEFRSFFRPQYRGIYGLAMFVRESVEVESEGELFVFKEQGFENPEAIGNHARNIQHLRLKTGHGLLTVVNFHGLWNGQGKTDSDDRLLQSQKIAAYLKSLDHAFVLAGDFNLVPESKSFRILADVCPQDFVRENGVTSTRTSFYPKPGKMADYILASRQLRASDFEVLPDEASDHAALRITLQL